MSDLKKKFRVAVSTTALVSQVIEVDAVNIDDAKSKVLANQMWNDGVWDHMGIEEETPNIVFVDECA